MGIHKVQFRLDDQEYDFFKEYAKRKGMSVTGLTKMALFQYAERFPKKGIELPETLHPRLPTQADKLYSK